MPASSELCQESSQVRGGKRLKPNVAATKLMLPILISDIFLPLSGLRVRLCTIFRGVVMVDCTFVISHDPFPLAPQLATA